MSCTPIYHESPNHVSLRGSKSLKCDQIKVSNKSFSTQLPISGFVVERLLLTISWYEGNKSQVFKELDVGSKICKKTHCITQISTFFWFLSFSKWSYWISHKLLNFILDAYKGFARDEFWLSNLRLGYSHWNSTKYQGYALLIGKRYYLRSWIEKVRMRT